MDATFKSRPVYIIVESYAGKYVPAIEYYSNLKIENRVKVATHAVNAYKQNALLEEIQLDTVGNVRTRRTQDKRDCIVHSI